MTITQYDPDQWLVTLVRGLKDYIASKINSGLVNVEMSYPDTSRWTKETPLDKTLIHMDIDNHLSRTVGMGHPGVETFTPSPDAGVSPATWRNDEAGEELVSFDMGIWASEESGGGTARLTYHQLLINLFNVAGAKEELRDATGGIWVVSFSGGQYTTDRINDLPVWRAHDMTLVTRVYSRRTGSEEVVPDTVTFDDEFTIADNSGNQVPVT